MNIPKPPWYDWTNRKLEGSEWLVNLILIGIIAISLLALVRADRVTKTAWAVYLISP